MEYLHEILLRLTKQFGSRRSLKIEGNYGCLIDVSGCLCTVYVFKAPTASDLSSVAVH